jgi:hypothetical protein
MADQTHHYKREWNSGGANDLNMGKVIGTWRFIERGPFYTSEILLTVYPDFRLFAVPLVVNFPCNGSWTIEGDIMVLTWDDPTKNPIQSIKIQNAGVDVKLIDISRNTIANRISALPAPIPQTNYLGNSLNPQKPTGNTIDINKLYGTWKGESSKGETFFFTVYPDQRFFNCIGINGNWTVNNDLFYSIPDHADRPFITKTISFSTSNWQYEGVGNGVKYSAQKVSDLPIRDIKNKCKQPPPPPCVCPTCQLSCNKCRCPLWCTCCAGNGTQQCSSCNGNGSRDVSQPNGRGGTETYRAHCGSCSSGRVTCRCCNGTGKQ